MGTARWYRGRRYTRRRLLAELVRLLIARAAVGPRTKDTEYLRGALNIGTEATAAEYQHNNFTCAWPESLHSRQNDM